MSKQDNLRRLMSPRHIVLIGGSNLELPIQNTKKIGFDGEIWVVNPKYDEIAGIKCYPTIADLPDAPDAAFVSVNAELTVDAVAQLREKGCGGAVCYAAGFAEVGGRGSELQDALVEVAGDMALVGPNCYGVLNFTNGVALWPDRLSGEKTERGVAIISQSGNVALNLTMHDRSLPITHVISVGNQAVMGVGDYIEPLLEQDNVSAIGFYIEGLKDIESFSRAALKAVEKGVPLVVLKAGTSDIGTQLTMSHTSSLAGSDDMYQAMFDRLGILRVHSLGELLETLKIAALCELPAGDRIGVLTCSGGDSAMLADSLDHYNLQLPQLTEHQKEKLGALLPDFASLSNPLDYNTSIWGNEEACTEVFGTLMEGDCDATILALDFPKEGLGDDHEWQVAVNAMIAAHAQHHKTAAVICNLSELMPENARHRLVKAGIAPLQGLKDGVTALARFVKYGLRRQQILALDNSSQLLLRQGTEAEGESRMLDEWDSKQLVGSYGLPLPGGQVVELADVAAVADQIGYPVVMKGVSDQLAHKTEAGAVVLNLKDADAVSTAAHAMSESLKTQGLDNVRFLIEPMISDFVGEMIIGLKRDEQFGLALIVGTGGILVNLLNDSATLLLPTSREAVSEAVGSLQGTKLLQGYRGKEMGDLDAVVDAVMAVAEFATEHWEHVTELDINPLMVRPQGKGAVAVDALVHMRS
ncbi:acetate--CoA ligase family protein [Pontibacterium granulatum]|uniref:acetate--CoA ligase family protein n=1 Tax=Pontibacterium granulatum TaxID=2036029 RepID=UPI002499D175|nr:acetate--CoA ligase family protein [Pontibacterium granulatum]MDI3323954.1 acetate--CoA ligase family protein [Pontibacterium granulatum]